jgi:hypothetical protein
MRRLARRLSLMAVISITLPIVLPTAVRAQACLGSVSFARVPVRLGGGAIFGKDYTGYAASLIAGRENAAFGAVGVARTYIDDFDDTADDVFVEFGYQKPAGTHAQLCPVVGASMGTGPDDFGKAKSRFASAGLALGLTFHPAPSTKIIPNGSLRLEYAASDVTDPTLGKLTYTDNSGVADVGLGLIFFNDRLALQPTMQLPFAADDNSVSYGLVISLGFGLKR